MEKAIIFNKELELIQNLNIRNFVIKALSMLPEYFWHIPASSTGMNHPEYAKDECGLLRHTIACATTAKWAFNLDQYKESFDDDTRDCIIGAILLHDGFKQGLEESGHTVKEHTLLGADFVKNVDFDIDNKNRTLISELIRTHMGQWDEDNKPQTEAQKFVHLCDYLGSRKDILFDFGDRFTN